MPQLRAEIVTDFESLQRIAPEWERLWKTDPAQRAFSSFAWTRAYWRGYGARRVLCSPIVYRGDRVVGILPLAVDRGTLGFLGTPGADYNDMFCEPDTGPEVLEIALQGVLRTPIPWKRGVLRHIPEQSNILRRLGKLDQGTQAHLYLSLGSLCPGVDLSADREKAIHTVLRKKTLKYYPKKLARLGEVTFRHLSSRDEIKSHLPRMFRQHIARWAIMGQPSMFREEETRTFYNALVDEFDPQNELRFSLVEVDGTPVAYHLGFEANDEFIFYKPTFDIGLWDYSPGQVLVKYLFEYLQQTDLKKFDFSVGDEPYKSRFANMFTRNHVLRLFKHKARCRAARPLLIVEDKIRQRPDWVQKLRKMQERVQSPIERLRRTQKCRGWLGLCKTVLSLAWRKVVFGRDTVFVFSGEPEGQCTAEQELTVEKVTLTDLACLAMETDCLLTPARLAVAQQCMQKGGDAYVFRKSGSPLCVVSTAVRSEVALADEEDHSPRVHLEEPGVVVLDCWTRPRERDTTIHAGVVATLLAKHGPSEGRLWICCAANCCALRRAAVAAGLEPVYRLQRSVLLGRWQSSRVTRCADGSLVEDRPDGTEGHAAS